MIKIEDYIEKRAAGLYFKPGDFYLDPRRSASHALISHGHADHAIASNKEVWCTPGTAAIMRARYGDKLKSALNEIPYKDTCTVNGVSVSFYPAGHILGSAQILIEYNGIKFCYTGDYKLNADDSCEAMEPLACDVLITETTFAEPGYSHPCDKSEIEQLDRFRDYSIVIGAYSLGKAQRLTKLINKHLPERNIMMHPDAALFNRVYENSGINLGPWSPYNYRKFKSDGNSVLVVPPRMLSSFHRTPGVVTAFATGWSKPKIWSMHHMRISDHADWNQILHLIEISGAKTVMTVHGSGETLKKHLNESKNNINVIL